MGIWELVKSIAGTKSGRNHVCLHSQAENRLWQLVVWHVSSILIYFQNFNEMALFFSILRYTKTDTKKSNTAGFQRIQKQENTKERTKKTTEVNLKIKVAIAQSIGQKGFAD